MKNDTRKNIKYLTLAAMFAAVIYVLTSLQLFKGVLPNGGYVHMGDAAIFIAAAILPTPYALCSGVIGASLADILSGSVSWVPATIVIKAVMALFISSKAPGIITKRNMILSFVAGLFCAGGYSLYELLIFGAGSALATFLSFLWLIQLIGSCAVYIGFGYTLDRIRFKETILKKI